AREALEGANLVVAIDQFLTDSSRLAHVVLPAAGFTEVEGTVTNLEGRVQKASRLVAAHGQSRPPWSIFEDIASSLGSSIGAHSAEAVQKEIAQVVPAYRGLTWEMLEWGSGRPGVVVPTEDGEQSLRYVPVDIGVAARPARLALHSARTLYDDGVHVRFGLSLAQLAAGSYAFINTDDAARLGVADGSMVRLTGSGGSSEFEVRHDATLAPGSVYVPFNQEDGLGLGDGLEIKLEVLS
ncbi:MAG: molybdopterin oxidoreductase family protein, partial [Acidimicrobiia bacterium]